MKENQLGSCHDDGTVAIWDTDKGSLNFKFDPHHDEPATSLIFSSVNHMLLGSVGLDRRLIFYDIYKGRKVVENLKLDEPLTSLSFNKDGYTIGVGTSEGKVCILDLRYLKNPMRVLEGHKGAVSEVMF